MMRGGGAGRCLEPQDARHGQAAGVVIGADRAGLLLEPAPQQRAALRVHAVGMPGRGRREVSCGSAW